MMRVGPCIPVGTQLWKADIGQLLGRIGVFLTWTSSAIHGWAASTAAVSASAILVTTRPTPAPARGGASSPSHHAAQALAPGPDLSRQPDRAQVGVGQDQGRRDTGHRTGA